MQLCRYWPHDADEHFPKPGHIQYVSELPELSHSSPCVTPIETAPANIRHTSPCGTMYIYRGSIIEQSQNALAIVKVHASPRETIHETASATIGRTIPCETMTNNASANFTRIQ